MTLVATFATNEFAVMVADKRRTHVEYPDVQFDDVTKVVKVNNKLLIGHSGDYYIAIDMINQMSPQITEVDPLEKIVHNFKSCINNLWSSGFERNRVQLTFHFAGVLKDGRLGIARISSFEDYRIVFIDIPPEQIRWDLSIANYNPSDWIKKHNFKGGTLVYLKSFAKKLIKEVSEKDNYVSREHDIISIEMFRA